jgi:alpha-glucosidase
MRLPARLLPLAFLVVLPSAAHAQTPLTVSSPSGEVQATFSLSREGRPEFKAAFRGVPIVEGQLGLAFLDAPPLSAGFEIAGSKATAHDAIYKIPIGKASQARDHYHELVVSLVEKNAPRRRLELVFRAFDDGLAFRYQLPQQEAPTEFVLADELTELTFPGDPQARLLPLNGYTTSYEKYYEDKPVSQISAETLIGLPLLLRSQPASKQPVWLAVTEAELTDYAGMYLAPAASKPDTLVARLSPLPGRSDGAKVRGRTPFESPWRVLMVADAPGKLLESNLVFNLSKPSAIADTSWIKPGKSTFPWWNGYVLEGVDFEPGLNTATHKHYIDFCAKYGVEYHSLDGTDRAWYGGPIAPEGPTDITKAVPEIDLPELLRYAREKGVRLRLWMHWQALKPQLDEALPIYEQWGIEGIMVDFMDRDDQEMVNWYHEVAEKAARHKLTVTWHGAYKPTGMERTWPNVLSYEAALNQEYNKWSQQGTPPVHNLDIAFVRMLAGPLDYHQGGMRNQLPRDFAPRNAAPTVQGTRAHQLALYVVYQNHLPMLVDYPAAYENQPGLDFLAEVPSNWDETRVLAAELGKVLVIARRKGDVWWLGGLGGDNRQAVQLPLAFLGPGEWTAKLYLDAPQGLATEVRQREQEASAGDTLQLELGEAGGFAGRISRRGR